MTGDDSLWPQLGLLQKATFVVALSETREFVGDCTSGGPNRLHALPMLIYCIHRLGPKSVGWKVEGVSQSDAERFDISQNRLQGIQRNIRIRVKEILSRSEVRCPKCRGYFPGRLRENLPSFVGIRVGLIDVGFCAPTSNSLHTLFKYFGLSAERVCMSMGCSTGDEPIPAQVEPHQFIVTNLLLLIRSLHLKNGYAGRPDGKHASHQRLPALQPKTERDVFRESGAEHDPCSAGKCGGSKLQNSSRAIRDGHGDWRLFHFGMGFDLGDLLIVVAFKCEETTKQLLAEWDHEALTWGVYVRGSKRIVISLRVRSAHNGRFITRDTRHLRRPLRQLFNRWSSRFVDLRQQVIIIALQRLVIPSHPTEVEYELGCGGSSNGQADPDLFPTKSSSRVSNCCRSKQHYREVKNPIPALEKASPSRVVESVPQRVEANVVQIALHFFSSLAGGGLAFWGCRGPADAVRWMTVSREPADLSTFSNRPVLGLRSTALPFLAKNHFFGSTLVGAGVGCLGPCEPPTLGCLTPAPFCTWDQLPPPESLAIAFHLALGRNLRISQHFLKSTKKGQSSRQKPPVLSKSTENCRGLHEDSGQ